MFDSAIYFDNKIPNWNLSSDSVSMFLDSIQDNFFIAQVDVNLSKNYKNKRGLDIDSITMVAIESF